jgi:hypothetical protein
MRLQKPARRFSRATAIPLRCERDLSAILASIHNVLQRLVQEARGDPAATGTGAGFLAEYRRG